MFDEVTHKNILAIQVYSKETRKLVRDLEENVKRLEGIVLTNDKTIRNQQSQIAILLAKVHGSGATGGS